MVLFPVLVKACGAARTYRVIVSIQTVVLFVTPLISYCAMSTATVSALYVFMSSFHLCRVILFKYPLRVVEPPSRHLHHRAHRRPQREEQPRQALRHQPDDLRLRAFHCRDNEES